MQSTLFALAALVQDAQPTGLRRWLHALPTDAPSIVTLVIAAAAVGMVIWSGTRTGNKPNR